MVAMPTPNGVRRSLLSVVIALAAVGCATAPAPDRHYDFFGRAESRSDPWFDQVEEWQVRARLDHPYVSVEEGLGARSTNLSEQAQEYQARKRLELAASISSWVRLEGRSHYVSDDEPASDSREERKSVFDVEPEAYNDHWPTYSELVEANGDDCDGLDLLAYQMLREFGFPEEQLFRAILMRQKDEVNHMVTFWFEDPDDPWVFDGTGAATREFVRFSEVKGWIPTNMFNEVAQYSIVERGNGKRAALERNDLPSSRSE